MAASVISDGIEYEPPPDLSPEQRVSALEWAFLRFTHLGIGQTYGAKSLSDLRWAWDQLRRPTPMVAGDLGLEEPTP